MKELKWIKVKEQHQLVTCTAVFKTQNDFYPIWFKQFPSVRDVTNSITRQQNFLYVPQTKTNAGARNFNVLDLEMWNGLTSVVTSAASLQALKNIYLATF